MESLLAELGPLLYGYNYQVFLGIYRVPFMSDASAEWYIRQALGPSAEIGGVAPVAGSEIEAEVEGSLRYAGDAGSGPKPSILKSRKFEALVSAVLSELRLTISGAELLARFWVRNGHPAYPVFWDFAFVMVGPSGGIVFIGSSSD